MQVILDRKLYGQLYDKIISDYKFSPRRGTIPFSFPHPYQLYRLANIPWTQEQEAWVNGIFEALVADDGFLYALDWDHEYFMFNPRERIPLYYHYHDDERDCNVYFPSYWPDGDYHFFITADWSFGMLGHPWRSELYLWGDGLTAHFEREAEYLGLEPMPCNEVS